MNNNLLNKLLTYYNLSIDEYKELIEDVDIDIFNFVYKYDCFYKAKEIIKKNIALNNKILIYGDYDCDGVLATSIIYLTIKEDNFVPGYYIPFRNIDGYGINKNKITEFYNLGYKLFILVDNGITLIDEINYIKELGCDCIIIDHHTILNELPKADCIIHYTFFNELKNNISAGALSFLFSIAYKAKIDPYLLSLGAITIFSDLMPQKAFNHKFSKIGLKVINDYKFKAITCLINKTHYISESDLYYSFIPKINSVGRIIENNNLFLVVKYFTDENNFEKYLNFLNAVNDERRRLIFSFDESKYQNEFDKDAIIINDNFNEGIIGLIANKLMEEYNKPSFIFTTDKNNNLKGSGRSKKGFDLIDFLTQNKNILLNYGGHNFACGLTINKSNFTKFKESAINYSKNHKFEQNVKYIEIEKNDISQDTYELIKTFAPFGKELENPLLLINDIPVSSLLFSKDLKHIITKINYNSSIVYFNYPEEIKQFDKISLLGHIDKNIFNTTITYQLKCINFKKILV